MLAEYGDVTCADGSYSTGVLYGQFVDDVLRSAAALPGGLNRVNLMTAVWNADTTNGTLLGGTLKLDGVNDAYWTEAAQIQEVQVVDGALDLRAASVMSSTSKARAAPTRADPSTSISRLPLVGSRLIIG